MQVHTSQPIGPVSAGREAFRILCTAQPVEKDGGSWIQLLPEGPDIQARDGRTVKASNLRKVAASTELPLLLDWDHASEFGSTLAAGWVEELAVETGSFRFSAPGLWGRVEYTPKGRADVQSRMYRYVSPVVIVEKESQEALFLAAVALTNRPALSMQAIEALAFALSKPSVAGRAPTQTHQFRNVPPGVDTQALRAKGLTDEEIQRAIDYENSIRARRVGEAFSTLPGTAAVVPEHLRATGLTADQIADLRAHHGLTDQEIVRACAYQRRVRGEQ